MRLSSGPCRRCGPSRIRRMGSTDLNVAEILDFTLQQSNSTARDFMRAESAWVISRKYVRRLLPMFEPVVIEGCLWFLNAPADLPELIVLDTLNTGSLIPKYQSM